MPDSAGSCTPLPGYLPGSGGIFGGITPIGSGGIGGSFGSAGGFGRLGGVGRLGGWIAGGLPEPSVLGSATWVVATVAPS